MIDLLIIDPQNDFADPKGSLYVEGANQDMERLTDLLKRVKSKINSIHVTLDNHYLVHVSNPIFWRNSNGDQPVPFTCITAKDMENGTWITRIPSHYKRTLDYLRKLESGGRYSHIIWPPHCLIGSWGASIYPPLFEALKNWEQDFHIVDMLSKGSNIWTEHFSVVKAEIPDPNDPNTQVNTNFIKRLEEAEEIVIGGIAGSHCVASSVIDIADNFSDPKYIQKMVLLLDTISPVPGFEKIQENFVKEMVARGMRTATTDDFI